MLRVRVLGGVAAEADGQPVSAPASGRALALLGWLAVHPGLHSRADVAARLWPDVVDASARQSMRSALWSLRQTLDEIDPAALVTTRDRVGLRADTAVDVVDFDAHVAAGRLVEAVELTGGELLAGVDDEWALVLRDEHRQRLGSVLAELAEQADDPAEAARWARRAAALDPLSEEAGRLLMSCLAVAGDRPAALAVYQKLADRLRRELRVAPSEPTWQLAEQIRTRVASAPSVRTRPGLLPLVGRDREFAELRAAWTAARAGHGGLALVHGHPGIGKTRLVTQLIDAALDDGGVVAAGAAPDLAGPPLALWVEVCAALARRLDPLPDAPWVAALAPMLPAHIPAAAGETPPDLAQARLVEAVVELVRTSAERSPVLLVLEDLHAADEASLVVLAHTARRLADQRVLVVGTRRERPVPDQLATLEQAARSAGTARADIALGPLDGAAISTLARAVGAAGEAAIAQVVTAADGNALLAVEAARALAAGEALPIGLRGAVRAALARVGPDARELLGTLAVAGRELAQSELAERAGVDLAQALPPAEHQGLLHCAAGRIRFRHALLRDALYADLPAAERAERHARAAAYLTASAGSSDRAGEAAAHLRAAGRLAEAGELLVAAAAQARCVGALTEATDLLRDACTVLPDDVPAALALADVLAWRNRPADVRDAFEAAVRLLERDADPAALARAYLRFAEWHYAPMCHPRVAVDACRRALTVMDGGGLSEPLLRAQILAVFAWCSSFGGEVSDVDAALAGLAELGAAELGDPIVETIANCARCFRAMRRGDFAGAVAPGLLAGDLALAARRPDLAYTGFINAAFALAVEADLDGALELLDCTLTSVRDEGMLAIEVMVQLDRAWVLARSQRLAEATEAAAQARRIADRLDGPDLQALVDAERGRVALRTGALEEAVELFDAALEVGQAGIGRPLARLQRADALARLGEFDAAEEELGRVVFEPVRPGDWPDTLVARMSGVEGLIAAGRGDDELAVRRLEEAAEGWRRRLSPAELGQRITDVMVDLGRPIIGLVVPQEELALVEADLARIAERAEV